MKSLKFNYEDHAEKVRKWREKTAFPLPPKDMLPDIGFIVDESACGFLYTSNSKIAWIEWVISNPEKTKEERQDSLSILFKLLEMTAVNLGFTVLFSASKIYAYSDILKQNGFNETDINMSHYVKIL